MTLVAAAQNEEQRSRMRAAALRMSVICGAAITFVDPILNGVTERNYLVIIGYPLAMLVVLVVSFKIASPRTASAPTKNIFHGPGHLPANCAWTRKEDTGAVLTKFSNPVKTPLLLIGASGVGKSTLLKSLLFPYLKKQQWQLVYVDSYESFKTTLLEEIQSTCDTEAAPHWQSNPNLSGASPPNKVLFVYDQFEKFFSTASTSPEERAQLLAWFRLFLHNTVEAEGVRHLIVVRTEWYYDLCFLDDLMPRSSEVIHLTGLRETRHETDVLLRDLRRVTKNDQGAQAVLSTLCKDHYVSPVEAQIVGLMLENSHVPGHISPETYTQLGGKPGLIRAYCQAYINSAPDLNVARKMLFALSVDRTQRTPRSVDHIAAVIHEHASAVEASLQFLKHEGLVTEQPSGSFELVHDYLAEIFYECSGSSLDPVERDNIVFFSHAQTSLCPRTLNTIQPVNRSFIFSDALLAALIFIIGCRLFLPTYGLTCWNFNPLQQFPVQTRYIPNLIDYYYMPVLMSHVAWSVYVTLLYRRLLSHLPESRLDRSFSIFIVINCAMCVLAAAIVPPMWLCSIALGGFPVGWKFYRLSKNAREKGAPPDRFLTDTGRNTMINVSLVFLVGLTYLWYVYTLPLTPALTATLNVVAMFMSVIMTYYMLAVRTQHITRSATSRIIGLIDRSRVQMQCG